jgi:hypothetical protein
MLENYKAIAKNLINHRWLYNASLKNLILSILPDYEAQCLTEYLA